MRPEKVPSSAFQAPSPPRGEGRSEEASPLAPPAGRGWRGAPGEGALASGTIAAKPATWTLAEEAPVAILINSEPYAVMMATPQDLEDFALGFVLSEGLVAHHSQVSNVIVLRQPEGLSVDVAVAEAHFIRIRMKKRALEGRVGCGLCGVAELAEALRMPATRVVKIESSEGVIALALNDLASHQPLNAENRSTHAAGFSSVDGRILLAREDVGRHNALDKLIGAMARGGLRPAQGFVVMTSRCSSELVVKCASVGIGLLATVSAPTTLALELARQCGMRLAARAGDHIMLFDRD